MQFPDFAADTFFFIFYYQRGLEASYPALKRQVGRAVLGVDVSSSRRTRNSIKGDITSMCVAVFAPPVSACPVIFGVFLAVHLSSSVFSRSVTPSLQLDASVLPFFYHSTNVSWEVDVASVFSRGKLNEQSSISPFSPRFFLCLLPPSLTVINYAEYSTLMED